MGMLGAIVGGASRAGDLMAQKSKQIDAVTLTITEQPLVDKLDDPVDVVRVIQRSSEEQQRQRETVSPVVQHHRLGLLRNSNLLLLWINYEQYIWNLSH